ncbi:MAG: hypothetical protein WCK78_13535 [Paludibacter sp.]
MEITHLKNKAIDYHRWDKCISLSANGLIYAYSWYLDVVSPDWEALVADDYSYVMPLPIKSRYKIPYLVQPVLTQQLGIFSAHEISESAVKKFIKEIPYFSYELALNDCNYYAKGLVFPNYILPLERSYPELAADYSKNTLRNIEKASRLGLHTGLLTTEEYIHFYFSVDKHYLSPRQPVLEHLLAKGTEQNAMELIGVFSADNELIAALCLLKTDKRLIYLLPVSNVKGKESYAMFLLIDELIKRNANEQKIFDFEGSRIEGVARLYRGFGAKNKPYYILKRFRPSFLVGKINSKETSRQGKK